MAIRSAYDHVWKHGTLNLSVCPQEPRIGIDLFDDEQRGFITIYVRLPNGKRTPARSIIATRQHQKHAQTCLNAWASCHPIVNDYRRDRSIMPVGHTQYHRRRPPRKKNA
jgi:hypothetical protein